MAPKKATAKDPTVKAQLASLTLTNEQLTQKVDTLVTENELLRKQNVELASVIENDLKAEAKTRIMAMSDYKETDLDNLSIEQLGQIEETLTKSRSDKATPFKTIRAGAASWSVLGVLNFDKYVTPPKFLNEVRNGRLKDVSIGFYYQPDFTPGTWNGQPYDYVMRDIVIDHVAAGVPKGRCTFPSCGIGVDAMMRRISLSHYGQYATWEECINANRDKDDPEAYCASLHGKGSSRVSSYGGKKQMAEKELEGWTTQTTTNEFEECVREKMAAHEGMTREQAEMLCAPPTKPEDEPTPYEALDQDELSPYQKCVKDKMSSGLTEADAQEACKQEGTPKTDQDAAFDNCVERKMDEGLTREEAEQECRAEHPVAEGDQEDVEKSPLERCIENQIDQGKTEEEATAWCEAELAGEHEAVDALIGHSKKLLRLREQNVIRKRRQRRMHPL